MSTEKKLPVVIVIQSREETLATMRVIDLVEARDILSAIGGEGCYSEITDAISWAESPIGIGNGYLDGKRFTIRVER